MATVRMSKGWGKGRYLKSEIAFAAETLEYARAEAGGERDGYVAEYDVLIIKSRSRGGHRGDKMGWQDIFGNDASAFEVVELVKGSGEIFDKWLEQEYIDMYKDDPEALSADTIDFVRLAADILNESLETVV